MKPIVISIKIIPNLLLINFAITSVLSANLTVNNDKYIGYNSERDKSCVLSAFEATLVIKPLNQTFVGTTYHNIRPEESLAIATKCSPQRILHYYRFNDTFDDNSKRQTSFSFGFAIDLVSKSVDVHIKYVEVFCDRPNGCLRLDRKYCDSKKKPEELSALNCLRMSTSFALTFLKNNMSYQCSHNPKENLKDVVYYGERPENKGFIEVDLHYVWIDATNSSHSFNPINYCLLDWILDPTIMLSVSSVVCLIIILMVFKCIIDCRRDQFKRKHSRKNAETLNGEKRHNNSETENFGQPIEL